MGGDALFSSCEAEVFLCGGFDVHTGEVHPAGIGNIGSHVGDVLDLAVTADVINKSGAWFAYNGNKIGQGRDNAKQYLKDNPEILAEVDRKVREFYHLPVDGASNAD